MCDDDFEYGVVSWVLSYQRFGILFLASLSIIVNSVFMAFVVRSCQMEEMPTKRFLCVLNRSAADTVTSLVTIVYLAMSLTSPCLDDPHFGCTTKDFLLHPLPLQIAISLNFWNVAACYSCVSLLIAYAVQSPITYKIRLTVKHVYLFLLFSWTMLILSLGAVYGFNDSFSESFNTHGMSYMVHGYFGETSYWQSDLCANLTRQEPFLLAIVSLAIPCFLLLLSILSYILVARALCARPAATLHQNALLRLGMHLALFALSVCLMSSTYFVSIPLLKHCQSKNKNESNCGFKPFSTYALLCAITSFGWYLRMSLDPVIDVAIDGTLRRLLFPRRRHRLSTYTLSTDHRLSMTAPRSSVPAESVVATRV